MWRHPNYYKNLRKLARLRNRDQAISLQAETSDARRTPGTGLKLGEMDIASSKQQAPSDKPEVPSSKPEATSSLILEPGTKK